MNIEVDRAVNGMVAVEFQGEGGEVVAVKIAATAVDDATAIDRAKAIMVQLATFGDFDPAQGERLRDGAVVFETSTVRPVVSTFGDAPSSAV
ncbi:hypothetical protein HGP17_09290 [Rhizobium sp. P38BS-XIX]|uniref:hypothetical protein n=1 Tax=Rhizobium sp. P38BS-XIX TaxID=2726740 RepID=UPI0014579364|nr:hypothetical protein [Rhizobium sp. P38BS-XIX]NLR97029.1 hypothetical protein [Rhizobium sp. P38BS-XIX]